jgi:hypothetical protein
MEEIVRKGEWEVSLPWNCTDDLRKKVHQILDESENPFESFCSTFGKDFVRVQNGRIYLG